jgi:hypothetical protein
MIRREEAGGDTFKEASSQTFMRKWSGAESLGGFGQTLREGPIGQPFRDTRFAVRFILGGRLSR